MHETGEMKRAQELRVDEFSVQKLRERYENHSEAYFYLTSARITRKDKLCD